MQQKLERVLEFDSQEFKFNSPHSIFDYEDSMSPKNTIEKLFSLNLGIFQEMKDVTKINYPQDEITLPFGGFDEHHHASSYDQLDYLWSNQEMQ
jgi:hypothetical protein